MQIKTKLLSAFLACTLFSSTAWAQDLLITNGRVLDGKGGVIENGSVVIRNGKITQVAAGRPNLNGLEVLDAKGMTVMPGFVDAHRHIVGGDGQAWLENEAAAQMQGFLDAGFTTVLSAIDPPQVVEVRDRIAAGEMVGPRLFAGSFVPLAGPAPCFEAGPGDAARTDPSRDGGYPCATPTIPDQVIENAVAGAAQAGYDYLKVVLVLSKGGSEVETLKKVVAEGNKHGLPTIMHATDVNATVAGLAAKPHMLVHTPHMGSLNKNPDALQTIIDAGIPMSSTLAVFQPHFEENGMPLFRDGGPYPFKALDSAGQGPVNARLLWEAGLVYGFGTDTRWEPKVSLADELRALQVVFAPRDIVTIITKHAAEVTLHGDEFGTLEAGKYGDVVIVDGDPLTDVSALLNVKATVKEGRVVFKD